MVTVGHQLALIALITQLSLPWVQGWHDARERGTIDASVATASIDNRGIHLSDPASAPIPHGQHDSDACPVCRLISQTRTALVAAARRDVGATLARRASAAPQRVAREAFRANAAAPRAPPHPLA